MADPVILSAAGLDAFVGEWIGDICPVGYDDDKFNHCAHFVSHVLKLNDALNLGPTCATTTLGRKKKYRDKGVGASVRVNDLFNACDPMTQTPTRGPSVSPPMSPTCSAQASAYANAPRRAPDAPRLGSGLRL